MVACELKVETLTIQFIEFTYCHVQYPKGGRYTIYYIMDKYDSIERTGSHSYPLFKERHYTIYCIMDKYDQYKENIHAHIQRKALHHLLHHG